MTRIAVLGGGAFGTALAIALSRDGTGVALWSRDTAAARAMGETRKTGVHLPDLDLPESLELVESIPAADVTLIAVPAQSVRGFLNEHSSKLNGRTLVSCAKGIERGTGCGPVDVIQAVLPDARAACLTGPSFAVDIGKGLPTALVLAMEGDAKTVQAILTRPALRIYRTSDITGAPIGGALKNVIAIAAGIAIGAGLGDSARASVIARGFAEMTRYATLKGARPETLQGLSGLEDLVLTCTSEKSRNFMAGQTLGRGHSLDPSLTVEGIATAQALAAEAAMANLAMPLCTAVSEVTEGRRSIGSAIDALLSRPAGKE